MRINRLTLLAAILIPAVPAMAQQDLISGVYARSPEQCAEAARDFQAFIETGETVLTEGGIEGIEYHCEFVDWKMSRRTPGAVVTALCEEPGFAYPEVYAMMPRGEGQLELSQALSVVQGEMAGNAGMYYRCEGVQMP